MLDFFFAIRNYKRPYRMKAISMPIRPTFRPICLSSAVDGSEIRTMFKVFDRERPTIDVGKITNLAKHLQDFQRAVDSSKSG